MPLESAHHRGMQLHPKDTGGYFFEIDWHQGGEDPAGPWSPAGPDWKPAVRTDVVSKIVAAELQSPDPDSLAKALGAGSRRSSSSTMRKGDTSCRSRTRVSASSRRQTDAARGSAASIWPWWTASGWLEAAEKRGRRVSDDLVSVCGTRFGLIDA